jgi:hypothetical protein
VFESDETVDDSSPPTAAVSTICNAGTCARRTAAAAMPKADDSGIA